MQEYLLDLKKKSAKYKVLFIFMKFDVKNSVYMYASLLSCSFILVLERPDEGGKR